MIRSRAAPTVLAAVAAALAITAIWLAFDNPTIDGTSRGEKYSCLAPWDTVVNDADNIPGGEPPPDADRIAARCRDAGHARFDTAAVSGAGAAALTAVAATLAWRRSRTRPRLRNDAAPPRPR